MKCVDICPLPINNCTGNEKRGYLSFLRQKPIFKPPGSYTSILLGQEIKLPVEQKQNGLPINPDTQACEGMISHFKYATSPENRGGTRGGEVNCHVTNLKIWASSHRG